MFEDKVLRLLEPESEVVIEAGGNCIVRSFIMDSPALHILDYTRVVKSRKGVAYNTRECIILDMCTWSDKNPGTTLQEQIHMTYEVVCFIFLQSELS
jgi:hypothetical protein